MSSRPTPDAATAALPATPAISVIVRTLGREARLADALESLASQTRQDFEAVIVDMGGGSATTIARVRRRLPSLLHLEVGGPIPRSAALNRGVAAARAPRLAILDDDNLYDPDHLDRLIAGLESSRADLVYTGVRRDTRTPEGERVEITEIDEAFDHSRLIVCNYIYTSATAFTREIWRRVGGFDRRFPVYEDWDFLIRVATRGRIVHLPGVSATSRSFTGKPEMPEHHREAESCARCLAGIVWIHRRLYTRSVLSAHGAAIAAHFPYVSRWGFTRERLPDLWRWWRGSRLEGREEPR